VISQIKDRGSDFYHNFKSADFRPFAVRRGRATRDVSAGGCSHGLSITWSTRWRCVVV